MNNDKKKLRISSFIYILFPLILTYQSNADIIWKFETNEKIFTK